MVASTCIVTGGRLYVVGGLSDRVLDVVLSSPVAKDGELGEWREEAPLPTALFGVSLAAVDDHIVVVGGVKTSAALSDRVLAGRLDRDGKLTWRTLDGVLPYGTAFAETLVVSSR